MPRYESYTTSYTNMFKAPDRYTVDKWGERTMSVLELKGESFYEYFNIKIEGKLM